MSDNRAAHAAGDKSGCHAVSSESVAHTVSSESVAHTASSGSAAHAAADISAECATAAVKKLYIGCHLSSARGFKAMGEDALRIGANTFAFFTRNPRGGKAKEIDPEDVKALIELMGKHDFGKLVAHAPYTLNPCSANKKVREFAYIAMKDDLERMEYLPGNYYNFHPGSHVGQGFEKGAALICDLLNRVIRREQTTTVLLETMAGKGSEVGSDFREISELIAGVELRSKIGVCLDTCHVNDGGYDIAGNLDGVLEEFDKVIGLEYLKAIHVNDSKNEINSHKDRHAAIGSGTIGVEALRKVVHHPALVSLPCILETPQENLNGYAEEIRMLRKEP